MIKEGYSIKKKTVCFILIVTGIIGIISGIIVSPEFAAEYLSADHQLEAEGLEQLRLFRLVSLFLGFALLIAGILLFRAPEKYFVFQRDMAKRVLFAAVVMYLVIFGYNTLIRMHNFGDPDTMNFIDVSRNISSGRGITQSALGFNQKHFSSDDQIPMPLIAQPPLYPLLIALFSVSGLLHIEAGLLISVLCYGLIILITYRLFLAIYDERAALLSVGFLLLYSPLHKVSRATFSEPPSIVLLFLTLYVLIQICRSKTYKNWVPVVAGLTTGLAFATRYAMLPLFGLGFLFILLESRHKLRDLILYASGFILPVGLVLGRNFIISGAIFSSRTPSTVSLKSNAIQAFQVITREYSVLFKPEVQVVLLALSLLLLAGLLVAQRKVSVTVQTVFIRKGAYLLTLWALGYLSFLLYTRTRVHLDSVDWRLVLPAGIFIFLILAAFIAETTKIKTEYLLCLLLLFTFFMITQEARNILRKPVYDKNQFIASSERLSWVERQTTERDLIIGDGTVDIVFYFERKAAISFSPFPEADVPEYNKFLAFCKKHCDEYENVYFIVRPRDHLISHAPDMQDAKPEDQEINMKHAYGTFITDIMYGKLHQYPAVSFLTRLNDADVFKFEYQL